MTGMGKKSSGPHTVQSMETVVSRLNEITAQIHASAILADIEPKVMELEVPLEVSLQDGMTFLQDWADSLRNAVRDEKLRLSRLPGAKKPVSDSNPKSAKPSRK